MNIWIYWDNPVGKTTPNYIQLCWESIRKHCGVDFNINLVTTNNIKDFLPSIGEEFFSLSQINNKSNYLRYNLLKEYGGIWLDSDIIILKNIKPLTNILNNEINLIATASPQYSYGQPECGLIISKPNGKVITKAADIINKKIASNPKGFNFPWGSMGPSILRQAVQGEKYKHLPSNLIMPIGWEQANRFQTRELLKLTYNENIYSYMLYHEMFRRYKSSILNMTKRELYESKMLISQIFRKAIREK
jgi:mannosyltransferase OCH1-like enzyme